MEEQHKIPKGWRQIIAEGSVEESPLTLSKLKEYFVSIYRNARGPMHILCSYEYAETLSRIAGYPSLEEYCKATKQRYDPKALLIELKIG